MLQNIWLTAEVGTKVCHKNAHIHHVRVKNSMCYTK